MTAQSGSNVLLKVGDGGAPETFATIGGLRLTNVVHRTPLRDVTTKDSGGFRELFESGIKSISITGSGFFTDSASEALVRSAALSGTIKSYQMTFGNGDVLAGKFQIESYQRGGGNTGTEVYTLSLASSGPFTFTAG